MMIDAKDAAAEFLAAAGWGGAERQPITGDASTRSYERLSLDGRRAVLMKAPPAAESAPCPPQASPAERADLGYNALARLAGPNLNAFIAIADALRAAGLSAPEIYAADPERGFALIEDFGDALFARAIPSGENEEALYAAAIDALIHLRRARLSPPQRADYMMLTYDQTALVAEAALFSEWYLPWRLGAPAPEGFAEEYAAAWVEALGMLSDETTLVLRDYHAENLLWLPERPGPARVGLIDFQDGLVGNPAYDLVSLLEDARRDVTPALAAAMIRRYCDALAALGMNEAAFQRDYALLAAQRNAKILGVFARLIKRDNKPRYAEFFPRVEAHFRNDLARPALAGVRRTIAPLLPDLAR